MAKFKIEFIDRKTTSTGKEMAKLSLVTEEGELLEGVSIWSDFPGFKDFKLNDYIEGDYKDTGQWKNLYAPKPVSAPRGGANIAKAQEVKAANIEKAQDRKHEAISIAGAFRDATLISLASLKDTPFPTEDEFKAEWTKWTKWILAQHDQPFL